MMVRLGAELGAGLGREDLTADERAFEKRSATVIPAANGIDILDGAFATRHQAQWGAIGTAHRIAFEVVASADDISNVNCCSSTGLVFMRWSHDDER
jgi:hypothetical protein